VALEDGLVAANPQGQLAAPRTARAAADWRIQDAEAALAEAGVQAAHERWRVGAQVDVRAARPQPVEQAVLAERDRLHLGRSGQGGEDHVGGLGDLARRGGPDGAGGQVRLGRLAAHIVDHQAVSSPPQVGGHVRAHRAQADESQRRHALQGSRSGVRAGPPHPRRAAYLPGRSVSLGLRRIGASRSTGTRAAQRDATR
jgi:hypothetical protein